MVRDATAELSAPAPLAGIPILRQWLHTTGVANALSSPGPGPNGVLGAVG